MSGGRFQPKSMTVAEATAAFRLYLLELRSSIAQGRMSQSAAQHMATTEWNRLAARVLEHEREQFIRPPDALLTGDA